MRRIVALATGLGLVLSGHAADIAGRWQGNAQIPGLPLQLTVDLDRDASGNWVGSIIIPELAMKGQPLMDIAAHDATAAFAIKGALVEPKAEPAKFEALLDSDAAMHGSFTI